MKEMSKFFSSFQADPEDQRVNKAAIHLRALIFERLSEDHVMAMALLHELGGIYRRAYGTAQVLECSSAQRVTQKDALEAHLHSLGLPSDLSELESCEVKAIVETWDAHAHALPRPFDATLQAFILHAKSQLSAVQKESRSHDYQSP